MLLDIRLRDFRCFPQLVFEPSPGLNFLVGRNAQGKTSLLEAICILLRLQSPRTSSLAETVRFGQPGFGLDGHWDERHLHLKFTHALKSFALDSKAQSRSADYLSVARVTWMSNDDLQLVRGSGSARRRYLDFLGAQVLSGYLRDLRAYERALRSRNALLKDNRPRREIAAFDPPLLAAGSNLLAARAKLCLALEPLVTQAYRRISGETESLKISYLPASGEDFAASLASSMEQEMRQRTTVVGPHRDDLSVLLDRREATTFASEGQQRSIAIALKLAQAGYLEATGSEPPIYLIDDVFGELDSSRRNNLLTALPHAAQKIVTSTHLDWLQAPDTATIYRLSGGQLQRE